MESGPVTACIFDGALGTESVATATVITGVPDPDMTWLMALEYFTWAADPAVYVYTQHTARHNSMLWTPRPLVLTLVKRSPSDRTQHYDSLM